MRGFACAELSTG